jgi:hypothetical protein
LVLLIIIYEDCKQTTNWTNSQEKHIQNSAETVAICEENLKENTLSKFNLFVGTSFLKNLTIRIRSWSTNNRSTNPRILAERWSKTLVTMTLAYTITNAISIAIVGAINTFSLRSQIQHRQTLLIDAHFIFTTFGAIWRQTRIL